MGIKRNRIGRKPTGWEAQTLATEIQNVNLEGGSSGSAVHNLVGSTHVVSGLDIGPPAEYLKALSATTFGFGYIAAADLPSVVGNPLAPEFGDGSDGDVIVSVDTTLMRPMYYNNLVINSGIKLICGIYPLFVRGTLTGDDGEIYEADPSGMNGAAGFAGTVSAGGQGGVGGQSGHDMLDDVFSFMKGIDGVPGGTNGVGSDGNPLAAQDIMTLYHAATSGNNGAAGGAGVSAGGAGGLADNCIGSIGGHGLSGIVSGTNYRTLAGATQVGIVLLGETNPIALYFIAHAANGGAGGGGGSDGAGGGGGGGGGGWCATNLRVFAYAIAGSGIFYCNGGAGGVGGAGYAGGTGCGGAGGGNGGGGGIILLGYVSKTGTWTTDVTGGSRGLGGAGGGTGSAGANGLDGLDGIVIEVH